MSFRARRELLSQVGPRYAEARHGQKSAILDEFLASTGYARKYAIRLLRRPLPPPGPIRRPRAPRYGPAVREGLRIAWSAVNGICTKRLVPFLSELVPALERHGHLVLTDDVRLLLLAISPATADRLLRPIRQPHGRSTTVERQLFLPTSCLTGECHSGWSHCLTGIVTHPVLLSHMVAGAVWGKPE